MNRCASLLRAAALVTVPLAVSVLAATVPSVAPEAKPASGPALAAAEVRDATAPPRGLMAASAPGRGQAGPPSWRSALRGSAKDYRFIAVRNGRPARWNPCAPIRYRINPGGMSRRDVREVQDAFARVAAASGLRFRYVGPTSYVWSRHGRGGAAPADAAFVFSFAGSGSGRGQSDLLGRRVVGIGGPSWRDDGRTMRIVSGRVVMNTGMVRLLPPGKGAGSRLNAYMHEIGHAVGLDHSSTRAQLMYPQLQADALPVFGAGDAAGLRRLGSAAGCLTRP